MTESIVWGLVLLVFSVSAVIWFAVHWVPPELRYDNARMDFVANNGLMLMRSPINNWAVRDPVEDRTLALDPDLRAAIDKAKAMWGAA